MSCCHFLYLLFVHCPLDYYGSSRHGSVDLLQWWGKIQEHGVDSSIVIVTIIRFHSVVLVLTLYKTLCWTSVKCDSKLHDWCFSLNALIERQVKRHKDGWAKGRRIMKVTKEEETRYNINARSGNNSSSDSWSSRRNIIYVFILKVDLSSPLLHSWYFNM